MNQYEVITVFTLCFILFALFAVMGLAPLFDGEPRQPTARETLARHADEQHAAIMRGDEHTGIYGKYPPADL